MQPSRKARIWWSGWLIVSSLFLQFASAAYACPMALTRSANPSMAGMPCAMAMSMSMSMSMEGVNDALPALDPEQPGLCLEHCKGGSQTVDPGHAASIAAPVRVALFVVTTPADALVRAQAWHAWRRGRENAPPPPPHAILHCCFRI